MSNAVSRMWTAVREQFSKEAGHLRVVHIPEAGAAPLKARDSYLRLSLSEMFLADEVRWGIDRIPAVQVSARMQYGALEQRAFTTLVQPPVTTGQGVFEDYPVTFWMPYWGERIELEVALHQVLGKNNLLTAVEIVSEFASLVTPPVSAALAVADKVAAGIEKVIRANAADPVLVLHKVLAAPAAGWVAVVRASEPELPAGELTVNADGRLCRGGQRLADLDYLVLRVESVRERDDWWTPDLDDAIRAAIEARASGQPEYDRLRMEAIMRVGNSPCLTPPQRKQAAALVKEELDDTTMGAVSDGGTTLRDLVRRRGLPSRASVEDLSLTDLLS